MRHTFYLNLSTAENLGIGLFKYALHPEKRFLIINSTLASILEYPSKKELKTKQLEDFFLNEEERDRFFAFLRHDGGARFFEACFKTRKGNKLWVAITASAVMDKRKHEYVEGIIEDITAHKATEEDLERKSSFLQELLDNIPDAVYFKDKDSKIIKVNNFYAKGVGLDPEEIIGKTDFDFYPQDLAQKMYDDDLSVLKSGNPIVGKIEKNLLPDGTWSQVITTKIPMHNGGGEVVGTMGITRDMTEYANFEQSQLSMLVNAVSALAKALEMHDPYTFSHTHRVARVAQRIGKALGWNDDKLLAMKLAGELHDVGKIGIPLEILNKPSTLTDAEYKAVQEHVLKCYELLKDFKFPFPLADIIYQHHERLDGNGYPRRLKGDQILFEARILAVSDVLEAMTHYRPYRKALGLEVALDELRSGRGTKYDPQVVDTVVDLVNNNGSDFLDT